MLKIIEKVMEMNTKSNQTENTSDTKIMRNSRKKKNEKDQEHEGNSFKKNELKK